jgi:WD40 repeat protein
MGDVREVYDAILDRDVAMKTVRVDNPEALSRFVLEARVTGKLQHPNIPPVHDLGVALDGQHYFTMSRVRGKSLMGLIQEDALGSLMERLDVFRKICDAMAYAHAREVIHRDLKPANIMIGEFGVVLVMDWGLAKLVGEGESGDGDGGPALVELGDAHQTRFGTVMGTPAWMAPEQALGQTDAVGPWSDIYSLGAILYALLTGKPPFAGTPEEMLSDSVTGKIVPPSERFPDRASPRELDSVVLRAMAKDPANRFSSVEELRAEIDAFLERRPLASADYSWVQRAAKWVARHKAVVTGATVVGVIALAVLAVGTWRYTADVGQARDRALLEAGRAAAEADRARAAERDALARLGDARMASADALARETRISEAYEHLEEARSIFVEIGAPLMSVDLRLADLESRFVLPARQWNAGEVAALSMRNDGAQVAVATSDGRVAVWDLPDERPVHQFDPRHQNPAARVVAVGWLGDEARAVVHDGELLSLVALPGGVEIGRVDHVPGGYNTVQLVAGRRVLVKYHPRGGDDRTWLPGEPSVQRIEWPDGLHVNRFVGRDLAAGSVDSGRRAVEIWDMATGARVWEREGWGSINVSDDGQTALLSEMSGDEIVLMEVATNKVRWVARGTNVQHGYVTGDAASVFTVEGSGRVTARRGSDGAPIAILAGELGGKLRTSFQVSADGKHVLGVLGNGDLALWHVDEASRWVGLEPCDSVWSVALSKDGEAAVASCTNGTAVLVDVIAGRVLAQVSVGGSGRGIDLAPDGSHAAIAGAGGQIWLWDLRAGTVAPAFQVDESHAVAVAFVQQGRALAGSGLAGVLEIRSFPDLGLIHRNENAHEGIVWAIEASPDGRRLATSGRDESDRFVRIWDSQTGALLHALGRQRAWSDSPPFRLAWSPDGRRVVSGHHSGQLVIWDLEEGSTRVIAAHGGPAMGVAFSPDGAVIASAGYDGAVSFWDTETLAPLAQFPRHAAPAADVVFSGDGNTIASGGSKPGLQAWGLQSHLDKKTLIAAVVEDLAQGNEGAAALERGAHLAAAAGYWEAAADKLERARAAGGNIAPLDRVRALCRANRLREARALLEALPAEQLTHPALHGWRLWLARQPSAE